MRVHLLYRQAFPLENRIGRFDDRANGHSALRIL
jgi:hypothetical protein